MPTSIRLLTLIAGFAFVVAFPACLRAEDKPAKPAKPISLTIEGDVDAELAPVAGQLTTLFYQGYPKLLARFESPLKPAPRAIRIVFVKGLRAPAQCSGDKIEVSTDWLVKHPKDVALLTHELTHAVQQYPGDSGPGWLTEGIADYARHVYGPKEQGGWKLPAKLTAKQSYKDSYRTAARFLLWLEERTPGAVDKLNRKMQDKEFKVEDFHAIAGRTLDALWDECVADLGR
jgi:Peptidase of plants and bacteria